MFNIHTYNLIVKKERFLGLNNMSLTLFMESTKRPVRKIDEKNFSSGRYDDWRKLIYEFKRQNTKKIEKGKEKIILFSCFNIFITSKSS